MRPYNEWLANARRWDALYQPPEYPLRNSILYVEPKPLLEQIECSFLPPASASAPHTPEPQSAKAAHAPQAK